MTLGEDNKDRVQSVSIYLDNGEEVRIQAANLISFTNEGRLEVIALQAAQPTMWSGFPFVVTFKEHGLEHKEEEDD
jgi:hypothetical protein